MGIINKIKNWWGGQKEKGDSARQRVMARGAYSKPQARQSLRQFNSNDYQRPEPQKVSFSDIRRNPGRSAVQAVKNFSYQDPTSFVPMASARKLITTAKLMETPRALKQIGGFKTDMAKYTRELVKRSRELEKLRDRLRISRNFHQQGRKALTPQDILNNLYK